MSIKNIIDAKAIERALTRIAHEIIEKNKGLEDIVILGIPTRGVHIAKRLRDILEATEGVHLPVGSVDATLYRDDIGMKQDQPMLKETDIPVSIDNKKIIIIDDVLFTGRTIRAAMNVIMDFGRPANIQLAVLIDRGHRELPIRPDYVGKNVPTSMQEKVKVRLKEIDGADEVVVEAE
ncbi:MAG: bifunctional pyr operon transcriptional regulator/uracil phosphoribosyltransferase PyrR [Deltaproteobacteria bacterium]|nr:bifunctional pyr operon transcriptional regulator/uracil phosphoribosyltransferase PyrR [Deltaproteobacteria bacterium]MBI3755607.1 bifunctional pyr operon transcriptional regulator/uracil phosphoribosyltransferase PyrR [Deltaproteobacteria bacterium]